ncbi:MAG TPA: hypothetical protein PKC91_10940 [Ignavibacteria bacterium]|nr:hypothetical protein [Ignavibacteria bacterium]
MHNISLIKLLRSFTPKEFSEFREFLLSPYFNKKNSVIKLYDIIRNYYPEFTSEEISKKNIHEKLFPGKVFNDTNLRVLVHNLNVLAKKFIAYRYFESNMFEYDFSQFMGLMSKQQFSILDKTIINLKNDLENYSFSAEEQNYYRFRLEYENIFYLSVSHIGNFEKFLEKADFEKVFYYLSSYYYLNTMRLYINILNLKLIYKKEFNTVRFEKLITLIDKSIFNDNPAIEIYYCIIKLFNAGDQDNYFFRIKEILVQIKNSLHEDDLREIYINLTNYCNRKINAGNLSFRKEKFEIYKEENEIKLYVVNGFMPTVYFKNLVILALSLDEYSWVKNFIKSYKNELPPDSKENFYNYCMALYEFDMKKFDRSLEFLSKIKYDELYLKYDSKILQLMIYFETGEEESLISSLEAYRHFLTNNKLLPENKKELYTNFYKFFSRIFNTKIKNDKLELRRIKDSIPSDMKIFNKDWLIRKIDKLI